MRRSAFVGDLLRMAANVGMECDETLMAGTITKSSSRIVVLLVAAILIATLLVACGGGGGSNNSNDTGGGGTGGNSGGSTGGSNQPSGQTVVNPQTVFNQLKAARFSKTPTGYGTVSYSQQAPDATDKTNGIVGIVQITFSGSSDALLLAVYGSNDQAAAGMQNYSNLLPSGSARKFLPYLPDADCADGQGGGACGIQSGLILVIAKSKAVAGGAAVLVEAGKALADSVQAKDIVPATGANPTGSSGSDACKLLTASEAASALKTSAVTQRTDLLGNCQYLSQQSPTNSVNLQPDSGGPSKYDFDRNRVTPVQDVTGVGDRAFIFVSQASFVELHILKGNNYVVVVLYNDADPNLTATATALGKIIAKRM